MKYHGRLLRLSIGNSDQSLVFTTKERSSELETSYSLTKGASQQQRGDKHHQNKKSWSVNVDMMMDEDNFLAFFHAMREGRILYMAFARYEDEEFVANHNGSCFPTAVSITGSWGKLITLRVELKGTGPLKDELDTQIVKPIPATAVNDGDGTLNSVTVISGTIQKNITPGQTVTINSDQLITQIQVRTPHNASIVAMYVDGKMFGYWNLYKAGTGVYETDNAETDDIALNNAMKSIEFRAFTYIEKSDVDTERIRVSVRDISDANSGVSEVTMECSRGTVSLEPGNTVSVLRDQRINSMYFWPSVETDRIDSVSVWRDGVKVKDYTVNNEDTVWWITDYEILRGGGIGLEFRVKASHVEITPVTPPEELVTVSFYTDGEGSAFADNGRLVTNLGEYPLPNRAAVTVPRLAKIEDIFFNVTNGKNISKIEVLRDGILASTLYAEYQPYQGAWKALKPYATDLLSVGNTFMIRATVEKDAEPVVPTDTINISLTNALVNALVLTSESGQVMALEGETVSLERPKSVSKVELLIPSEDLQSVKIYRDGTLVGTFNVTLDDVGDYYINNVSSGIFATGNTFTFEPIAATSDKYTLSVESAQGLIECYIRRPNGNTDTVAAGQSGSFDKSGQPFEYVYINVDSDYDVTGAYLSINGGSFKEHSIQFAGQSGSVLTLAINDLTGMEGVINSMTVRVTLQRKSTGDIQIQFNAGDFAQAEIICADFGRRTINKADGWVTFYFTGDSPVTAKVLSPGGPVHWRNTANNYDESEGDPSMIIMPASYRNKAFIAKNT